MAKTGTTPCTLDELCFPVELIENPAQTNREYSRIVRGKVPVHVALTEDEQKEYIKEGEEIEAMLAAMNGDSHVATEISAPTFKVVETEMDLNYCSPVYELVPNKSIFPEVEKILKAHGIDFTAKYSHTNNTRFYGSFTIEDKRFSYKMKGMKDEIKFVWNFQHSYNGLTKYKGEAGFFRLVCSNGLTVPVKEMEDYNLSIQGKHTNSILHSLERFNNILTYVVENLGDVKDAITTKYETLNDSWIADPRERVEAVLKANKINILDNSKFNTLNDIMGRITKESKKKSMNYKGRVNNWLVYNGINAYIHDDSRNIVSPEKRRETDSKVLEYMLETV